MDAKNYESQPLFSFKYLALYSLAYIILHIAFIMVYHNEAELSGYNLFLIPVLLELGIFLCFRWKTYPPLWLEKFVNFILLSLFFTIAILLVEEKGVLYPVVILALIVYFFAQYIIAVVAMIFFYLIRLLGSRASHAPKP